MSLPSPTYLHVAHPILVYLSRNNNSQAQARRFPALTAPAPEFPVIFGSKWDPLTSAWRQGGAREAPAPRDSLNFRQTSLLSSNEFESGTFTIVLHATSSFTYVSVIYGANFPFNLLSAKLSFQLWYPGGNCLKVTFFVFVFLCLWVSFVPCHVFLHFSL